MRFAVRKQEDLALRVFLPANPCIDCYSPAHPSSSSFSPMALSLFSSSLRASRIEALSDAVFGIVMTILVVEIPAPDLDHPTAQNITHALVNLWPRFLVYFVSFIMLGTFWVAQHEQFHFVKRVDQGFLWLTMLFLMLVASVPFSTTLIGRYLEMQPVVAFYGAHLLAISIVHLATWHHTTRHQRLVDPNVDPLDIQSHLRRSLGMSMIYFVAMGLSFISTIFSIAVYTLVPIVYSTLPSLYAGKHILRR